MFSSNPKLRTTRQRQVILEELGKSNSHLTADEVYEIVRRRLPRISLGTIYRNLETLSESGAIRKLELGGPQKRFDGRSDGHYHVLCTNCGRLDDVTPRSTPDIEDAFHNVCDYQITGFVLTGLCPDCRKIKFQESLGKEK